ncbi:Bug family tripartite tricarboxylate transporter substrate binding protein [Pelagibacterium limicola]|uniref:Bug family tripartite tricarboxylate transporter substrate binding protein n=1 Tax=Pelagibacterium limicola TaxID=2791022 RepID=UPI0018AF7C57|nr:tripartite tricarboxylate transporter substrate binding protein [Pelagibacterium limicola]
MRALLATVGVFALTLSANAFEFPTKPVTIVIPFAPGGSTDLIARQLASELGSIWDQPVVVESRPGAGSMIGTAGVAQSEPDGHTLLVTTAAFATAPAIMDDLPFDPQTDITPIAMVGSSPFIIAAGSNVNADNLEDFISEARERPMFIATPGVGSSGHFAGELFSSGTGIEMDVVHFNGGSEAIANLMGGHADILINTTAAILPQVRGGNIKAIGVLGLERYEGLEDGQTTAELGIETADVSGWIGVMGPGGMSAELIEKIYADIQEAMATSTFAELLETNSMNVSTMTSAEFAVNIAAESAMWIALASERGITRD